MLVVRGDPGIGKSALLDRAAELATGFRILRCTGVESEAELAFAALHTVLRPGLGLLDLLPAPQAMTLRGAFGLAVAPPVDRFLAGLATLSLLSELAEEGPVLCLVDDAHWLDHASATALLFSGRRLEAEGVVMVLAARDGFEAPGFPEMTLTGLDRRAAEALLDEHVAGLSGPARERILAEAAGNPLALRELPNLIAHGPLGPGTLPLPQRLQDAYAREIDRLPKPAQRFLLLAAAHQHGDSGTVLHAAAALGLAEEATQIAEQSGLVTIEVPHITFRHPLIRSATYRRATSGQRREAHLALADVLTDEADAHLRAWHLAGAATGPDERIAAELERTALHNGRRYGHGAVAAALEHAAALTPDPGRQATRLVVAAEASWAAGHPDAVTDLTARAVLQTKDPPLLARVAQVRALMLNERGATKQAYEALAAAADTIAGADPQAAVRMLIQAILVVWYDDAARVEQATGRLRLLTASGEAAASTTSTGALSETLAALRSFTDDPADPYRMIIDMLGGHLTGDFDTARELCLAATEQFRDVGLIGLLPLMSSALSGTEIVLGRIRDAASSAAEGLRLAVEIDQPRYAAHLRAILAWVAAVEGAEQRCRDLAGQAGEFAARTDNPSTANWAAWALATLDLGQGRPEAALERLEVQAHVFNQHPIGILLQAPDRIEAALRIGRPERAAEPLALLTEWAEAGGASSWSRQMLHRCLAITGPPEEAERHFETALALQAGGSAFAQARTELLYGEWLRRTRRRARARTVLRTALEHFESSGAVPWAGRTRAELRAAGEKAAPPGSAAARLSLLTPQELQVVRLAATGATNREIASRLFLSPRTISHHLYNAFPKLGVTTRTELAGLDLADGA